VIELSKTRKSVVVKWKNGESYNFEDIDDIHIFQDKNGINWLSLGNYGEPNEDKIGSAVKTSIPIDSINFYEVISNWDE